MKVFFNCHNHREVVGMDTDPAGEQYIFISRKVSIMTAYCVGKRQLNNEMSDLYDRSF